MRRRQRKDEYLAVMVRSLGTNAASVLLPKLATNQTATSGAKHLGHNYLACFPFLPPSTYTFASPKPKARPWRTWRASLPTA